MHLQFIIFTATFVGALDLIKGDNLILLFGENQILRKGDDLSFSECNQIRAKLHFLARLLAQLHVVTNSKRTFSELLSPEFYDAFVESVLTIRDQNKQLALTLGHYIKQICLLNIAESIKSNNKQFEKQSEKFLKLFNSSWSNTVASSTARLQQKNKLNKTLLLPETSDLQKLTTFINKALMSNSTEYTMLQKLIMTALILYNKRRPAEVAEIKISDYLLSLENQEDRSEVIDSLSPEEKVVASR